MVIDATLYDDGSIEVFHDIGNADERAFGDRDYEFLLTIPRNQIGGLAPALIAQTYMNDGQAQSNIVPLCNPNGMGSSNWC